jgi:FkbM family methyltransferase
MPHLTDKARRNVLVSTDHGFMIVNRFDFNDVTVGQGQMLLEHGNASTVEADVCARLLFERCHDQQISQPIIFDVGANIGTWTTWMANFFPNGQLHAFEPQRLVAQILAGNCAINNITNVYVHQMALGEESSTVTISEPDYDQCQSFGNFSLIDSKRIKTTSNNIIVQQKSIDETMPMLQLNRLDLLKIDAEGMDYMILKGATNTLKTHQPIIFVEHSDTFSTLRSQILNFLEWLGYECQDHGREMVAVMPPPTTDTQ